MTAYETTALLDAAGISGELLRRVRRLPPGERLVRTRRPDGSWEERVERLPAPPAGRREARAAPAGPGYMIVATDRVSHALRKAVEAEVPTLCRALGVPEPEVLYFRPALAGEVPHFRHTRDRPIVGACWSEGVVALSKDLTPRQGVEILAHEVAHLRGDMTEDDCLRAEGLPWTLRGRLS